MVVILDINGTDFKIGYGNVDGWYFYTNIYIIIELV